MRTCSHKGSGLRALSAATTVAADSCAAAMAWSTANRRYQSAVFLLIQATVGSFCSSWKARMISLSAQWRASAMPPSTLGRGSYSVRSSQLDGVESGQYATASLPVVSSIHAMYHVSISPSPGL